MQAIMQLERLGYEFKATEGNRIHYWPSSRRAPDEATVRPLFVELCAKKDEALRFLRLRKTTQIFEAALHEVNELHMQSPRALDFVGRRFGEEIRTATARVDEMWIQALNDKSSVRDFERVVTTWKSILMRAIQFHGRSKGKVDAPMPAKH